MASPTVHKADEDALVDAARAGDSRAFGTLVETYGRPVFNLALRMTGNPEDARDLVQVVFVKAYERLETFDGRSRFFSWIYRIAINESLNFVSRRKRVVELDDQLVSNERTPDEQAARGEEERMVQAAMQDLTPEYRQVIILRHFLDLSHVEMGSVLRLPEKTVKSRLHTARVRLAEALRKRGYGPQ
ncbi:MAG TPA: sigma-70 family RNA polymerase sigma factor [Candidatus Eisenbacteria bacterium]|nr:sigma-70 family RNA polymerase sigma factor [Candidatus Eisenbacteria bacterium]